MVGCWRGISIQIHVLCGCSPSLLLLRRLETLDVDVDVDVDADVLDDVRGRWSCCNRRACRDLGVHVAVGVG